MNVISTHGLHITHGARTVVSPFDWQVNAGEKWAILGANGAGKSSLLHALLGVERQALPYVSLMGHRLNQLSAQAQADVRVWVAQRYDEPFTITVRQALDSIVHRLTDAQAQQCLAQFGLLSHQNAWVDQLSGGERQRLTWAMAAARHQSNTQLWLLDEPLAAQDLAWQMRLLNHLVQLPCAVVAAVHDLNQVQHFASHVLLMLPHEKGSQVLLGRREEMMNAELLEQVYGVQLHLEVSQTGAHWWCV